MVVQSDTQWLEALQAKPPGLDLVFPLFFPLRACRCSVRHEISPSPKFFKRSLNTPSSGFRPQICVHREVMREQHDCVAFGKLPLFVELKIVDFVRAGHDCRHTKAPGFILDRLKKWNTCDA